MPSGHDDSIILRDAPNIPGLAFRHFRGDEDYPALLAVNHGSKIADGMQHDLHTLESITHSYNNSHNHDPRRDMLIGEVGGKMIAYNRVFLDRELDGTRVYWHFGFVLPEWRGMGIGKAMLHWVENHARELDRNDEGSGPIYASTETYSNMLTLPALLEEIGYHAVRYQFHMETPDLDHIPDVPLPAGLEIRPAQSDQYRAIWDASTEAFKDHWGASEVDESDYAAFLADPLQNSDLWIVAWAGDAVVGSILNFVNQEYNQNTGRKLGYTESISVRRPWRRLGLARAMLARSMQMFKERGMTQTALGVDTENPSGALRLYENMGYQVVGKSTIYRKRL